MLVFIGIFFVINVLANWYIFSRIFLFFHFTKGWLYWLIIFGFSVSYVFAAWVDHRAGFFLSRWLLKAAGFWMGAGLITLMCLIAGDLLRLTTPQTLDMLRWVVLGGAAALISYSLLNAFFIEVVEITVPAPVDKTLVQLSDIHVGSVGSTHLRRLVSITNALKPDAVLMTGDLMDSWSGLSDQTFDSLKQIAVPVFFVIGNHERYTGLKRVEDLVGHTPMTPLRNTSAEWEGIQLIGIDDSEHPEQLMRVLSQIDVDENKYSILLYHRPSEFEFAAGKGIDLMLSGHTHNGQVFPFHFVVKSRFPHMKGLHKIGDSTLFISTGSGTWGPPMRLGSRNQVIVIKLRKAAD